MKASIVSDPVVQAYLKHVDRSLLRENLKLTPGQRLEKFARFVAFAAQLSEAGGRARAASRPRSK